MKRMKESVAQTDASETMCQRRGPWNQGDPGATEDEWKRSKSRLKSLCTFREIVGESSAKYNLCSILSWEVKNNLEWDRNSRH